ncbi:MAG: hypothetical protein JW810_14525 [Sedimentisphaerales bacterium]|nr:hypothetical protein [Sedimentisphaerales bacterium]
MKHGIRLSQKNLRPLVQRLRRMRPRTRAQLAAYVQAFWGLTIPDQRICPDHDSPLDYLAYAFLGGTPSDRGSSDMAATPSAGAETAEIPALGSLHTPAPVPHACRPAGLGRDAVIWANRGGGKTQLGAIASLLECLFLPGCRVRILGGSQEQSRRMYENLTDALARGFEENLLGPLRTNGCTFRNRSEVQILSQSDRSVRGLHVQRLRCDEVELFDPGVWQAAQFITQSRPHIAAGVQVFSTLHRPYGLMQEILTLAAETGMRTFRWCLWEVIERCRGRSCSQCGLWSDCGGRARRANGYYRIDDALAQKRRSSAAAWRTEMLCQRPQQQDIVFAEFDAALHVRPHGYRAELPLYRAIDFGYSNPLVCLFLQVDDDGRVFVIDEHIKSRTTLAEHTRLIERQYPYPVEATYCDPAGRQRNEITGTSAITELKALGIPTQCRPSQVLDGIELIRRFLRPAVGGTNLLIAPRCPRLIQAFQQLRYQRLAGGSLSEQPEKDGVHDHLIDALRYFFVNRFGRPRQLRELRY